MGLGVGDSGRARQRKSSAATLARDSRVRTPNPLVDRTSADMIYHKQKYNAFLVSGCRVVSPAPKASNLTIAPC